MTFDLRTITISYSEPTLWWTVGISTLVAILLGHHIGRWLALTQDPSRRRVFGVILTAGFLLALLVLPVALLYALFSARTNGAMVCVTFVKPALLVPAALGLGIEALSWWRRSLCQ